MFVLTGILRVNYQISAKVAVLMLGLILFSKWMVADSITAKDTKQIQRKLS